MIPVAKTYSQCRFFNGIQHKTCRAGVKYDEVRDSTVRPYRWPCLTLIERQPATTTCDQRSLLTKEEHDAQETEAKKAIAAFFQDMADGKCPICKKPIEPARIIGRCKCAACGHRLGYVGGPEDE